MLRIWIDARRYESGMWVYLSHLIDKLSLLDKTNQYALIVNRKHYDLFPGLPENFRKIKTVFTIENHVFGEIWRNVFLPRKMVREKVDVFHDPGYFLPYSNGKFKKIVTFHDLVAFVHKETNSRKYFTYMRAITRLSAKLADTIIADSQHTKNDILRLLDVPEERVKVIYLAAGSNFFPIRDEQLKTDFKKRYELPEHYILNMGTIEPRKNIPRLLDAFHRLKLKYDIPHKLVIGGSFGWLYKPVLQKIKDFRLSQEVVMPGFIKNENLNLLYNAAEAFVFPSLYEGFGLPPLEAISCGIPVASSNTSCLPEILGDGALYFDPYDVGDMSEALWKIISSPSIREKLEEKALLQAAKFSWTETARQTLDIYQS